MSSKKENITERIYYKNVSMTRNLNTHGEVTTEQLKAARSLLNWSQADLAQKSGYSLPAVNNIERGQYKAHTATMNDIIQTFEQNGIQFISSGVRLEHSDFRIKFYEGEDAPHYLLQKISAALEEGGDLYLSGIDENALIQLAEKDLKRCLVKLRQAHATIHLLCHKSDKSVDFAFPNLKQKIVPDSVPLTPYCLYKNRCAFVILNNPVYVCIIYNPVLKQSMLDSFNYLCENAR